MTISIRGSSVLKASFLVYMVPILALTGGAFSGYLLAKLFSVNENLLVGTLAGVALFSSFLWLKKRGSKFFERQEFIPEIISKQAPERRIPPADLPCPVN